MILIGIGGTNGSGKDTGGKLLGEKYNLLVISVSDFLRDEAKKRGLPIEREVLRTISAEWRRQHGLGVLVDKSIEAYERSKNKFAGVIAIPLRNPGEADRVHELGGVVVWVDADPRIRYERIVGRRRSAEDNKTFAEFMAEEEAEMVHSGDEATLNMAYVKEHADISIINNYADTAELKQTVEDELRPALTKKSTH